MKEAHKIAISGMQKNPNFSKILLNLTVAIL